MSEEQLRLDADLMRVLRAGVTHASSGPCRTAIASSSWAGWR